MAVEQFANSPTPSSPSTAWTTLNGAIGAATSPITVTANAAFPSTVQYRILIDNELMLVTAGAGTNSWTVTRGVEGTTAVAHADAAGVYHILTAVSLVAAVTDRAVTNIATTSPISGGPITSTGTVSLLVNVDFAFTAGQTITAPAGSTALTLTGGTQTVSRPALSVTQTWNAGAVVFTAMKLNVTNTASAAGSLLLDLQSAGTSRFYFTKTGGMILSDPANGTASIQAGLFNGELAFGGNTPSNTSTALYVNNNNLDISVRSDGYYAFAANTSNNGASTLDVRMYRDAAQTLAHRNGTNAQGLNLYNTFTSATNFERLMLDWITTANVAMIYTQVGGGGGTARVLQLNYGGTTTSALSIPITSGTLTFGGSLTTTGVTAIIASGTAIPAGGTAGTGYRFSSTANYGIFFGSGVPTLTAAQGSLYLRSDGSTTSTRAYINTDGAGTWTAITTAA